jgi:ATP-dependent Clp protease ATP-binding subunit ClpA
VLVGFAAETEDLLANAQKKVMAKNLDLIVVNDVGNEEIGFRTVSDTAPSRSSRGLSAGASKAKNAIERTFSPEFRNRLDAMIQFNQLTMADVERVVDKFIGELQAQLAEKHVTLTLTDAARSWFAQQGFDALYGARPMARLIQQKVKEPLAEELLFGQLQHGGQVVVEVADDDIRLAISPSASET